MLTQCFHLRVKTPNRIFMICSRAQLKLCGFFSLSPRCSRVSSKGKTSTSIRTDSLPQGVIQLQPLFLEEDVPSYPTVVQQARTNMQKFQNCVLLTRVGGFYEMYFEQAEEVGPLLSLKVAIKKTNAGPVPMAGFPFFQLDRYLKVLVQDLNRYVAIAEEFPNDTIEKLKAGGLMHDRRITRVITPGTLIDEEFMDPFSNSYILAIQFDKKLLDSMSTQIRPDSEISKSASIGLAWLDLSTGHFFTQLTNMAELPSVLARISPREIVLHNSLKRTSHQDIFSAFAQDTNLISYTDVSEVRPISEWTPMLESPVPTKSIKDFTPEEVSAGSSLLQYVESKLQGSNTKLQPPMRQLDLMSIDKNTLRALELRCTMGGDSIVGSLLHTIRNTVTKGGARLLERWLCSPSTSLDVINSRLDLVELLINDKILRQKITMLLRKSHDSYRLIQKFAFGRGSPDDLLGISNTIDSTQEIFDILQNIAHNLTVQSVIKRIKLNGPIDLSERIKSIIDEEGIIVEKRRVEEDESKFQALTQEVLCNENQGEDTNILPKTMTRRKKTAKQISIREHYSENGGAWIMKTSASPTLTRLHHEYSRLNQDKEVLEKELCASLEATSLTLRFSPGLGHICHVKGKDININAQNIKSVGSSKSTRSFHHPEWTELGHKIDQCNFHIRAEERQVFQSLSQQVIKNIVKIRRNAAVLDELDVACSSATLATERSWSRPILNLGTKHKIVAGRHPTVECGLENEGRSFVSNDCYVGHNCRTWLITGPNMGGKSTFLRQNALITILAQTGSYVPASFVEIGIVDQIFSRVGSADNLYKDQSTFMLEMLETAHILKMATTKSFVIMDEIGRGTTPEDGEAVAWACLWYLNCISKCRTLFATHFHGLSDRTLSEGLKGVGLWCTDIEEEEGASDLGGSFRYVHRLKEGVNRRSHALKVARLAGLPKEAIMVAQNLLSEDKNSAEKL